MEYIASLSYGKDSIAMLEAIKILGLPLDRIIHAEVWATDTIPADLPPRVEFKAKADKLILEKYGIVVEHTCATRGGSGGHTIVVSTPSLPKERVETKIGADFAEVSLTKKARGANETSNLILSPPLEKLTYEKLFYRQYQRGGAARRDTRICETNSQVLCLRTQTTRSRQNTTFLTRSEDGATGSKRNIYGFPMRKGNWCTSSLKTSLFRQPRAARG